MSSTTLNSQWEVHHRILQEPWSSSRTSSASNGICAQIRDADQILTARPTAICDGPLALGLLSQTPARDKQTGPVPCHFVLRVMREELLQHLSTGAVAHTCSKLEKLKTKSLAQLLMLHFARALAEQVGSMGRSPRTPFNTHPKQDTPHFKMFQVERQLSPQCFNHLCQDGGISAGVSPGMLHGIRRPLENAMTRSLSCHLST